MLVEYFAAGSRELLAALYRRRSGLLASSKVGKTSRLPGGSQRLASRFPVLSVAVQDLTSRLDPIGNGWVWVAGPLRRTPSAITAAGSHGSALLEKLFPRVWQRFVPDRNDEWPQHTVDVLLMGERVKPWLAE